MCCVHRELECSGGFWYIKGDGGYRWVGVWELGVLLWGSWVAQGGQGDWGVWMCRGWGDWSGQTAARGELEGGVGV